MDLEKKLNLEVVSQENYEQYTKESKVIHEQRREINKFFNEKTKQKKMAQRKDLQNIVKDFNNKYNYKIKLTKNYPLLVEFTDGKVTGLVQGEDGNSLSISKMKQFIEIHKIGKTN